MCIIFVYAAGLRAINTSFQQGMLYIYEDVVGVIGS